MSNQLQEWLEETVKLYPDKIVFSQEEEEITFAQLAAKAQAEAEKLIELKQSTVQTLNLDVTQKDEKQEKLGTNEQEFQRVLPVTAERKISTIVSYLGIAMAGDVYAPIPSDIPQNKMMSIMASLATGQLPISRTGEHPLMLAQTSGSTGKPKAVCLSREGIAHYVESFGQAMEIGSDEVLACQANFDYVAAIRDIYLPICYGCTTAIIPKDYFVNPQKLYDFLKAKQVTTLCWSVSAMTTVEKLGMLTDYDFSFIKKVIFTGSQIHGGILRRWQLALPNATFINHYGPSEATASCTYYVIDHPIKTFEHIPIGDTLPGYDIFLLPAYKEFEDGPIQKVLEYTNQEKASTKIDSNQREDTTTNKESFDDSEHNTTISSDLNMHKKYEICVAGPGLAMGYFDDPLLTQMKFEVRDDLDTPEPIRIYHTGDLGYVENGNLVFAGRMDRQIKHMDYRVELDGIEFVAQTINNLEDVAVVNDASRDKIVLFYTLKDFCFINQNDRTVISDNLNDTSENHTSENHTIGNQENKKAVDWTSDLEISDGDIIDYLKLRLPNYMIPRKVVRLETMPKLANGKIDYRSLEATFEVEKKSLPKVNP